MELQAGVFVYVGLQPGTDGGIVLGSVQPSPKSHNAPPAPSDPVGRIDKAWPFFANTGYDFTGTGKSNVTGNTIDGVVALNAGTLDFSNWRVTWNGIPSIDQGGCKSGVNCPAGAIDTSIATLACTVADTTTPIACANGTDFTLDYVAHVPVGDPSGFGGVPYSLHLTGVIVIPATPLLVKAGLVVGPGATATGQGLTTSRMTRTELTAAGVAKDPVMAQTCVGDCFDFKLSGLTSGASGSVVLPLRAGIPAEAVYRKYDTATATWKNFDTSGGDVVASAARLGSTCPSPGNSAYKAGLMAGDYCVELTIKDGGPNDADGAANGVVVDPGGIGVPPVAAVVTQIAPSGTSGCSISPTPVSAWRGGAWWIMGTVIGWLGFSRRRRSARQS